MRGWSGTWSQGLGSTRGELVAERSDPFTVSFSITVGRGDLEQVGRGEGFRLGRKEGRDIGPFVPIRLEFVPPWLLVRELALPDRGLWEKGRD